MIVYFIYLLILASIIGAGPTPKPTPSCGYESCTLPKEGNYLNLHIVAHTHDDVGWLKTYDEYYYGNNNSIQAAGVQYILDSVIPELIHDPSKRFIYVETAFFWKWWMEQTDSLRHQVKNLVNRGQLEFVGGAWSMHDEAAAHYHSMLDQTTWGFRKLDDTFGKCGRPKVGWQIDPFGHSKENANLMANYGFDGLFLGRIDWEDKIWRAKNKTMEMVWHTSSSDDSDASKLFTGVLYNVYAPPKGFCFDVSCDDEPIVDNKNSPKYNAEQRAEEFVKKMLEYAKAYRTNNVLVTMGEDFHFQNAHMNFKNIDKLIRGVNNIEVDGLKMNAFYSTPSCYLKAVNNKQIPLPTKSDDFMPYSSDPYSFWTGYYTSRPTSKHFERKGNNFLQVCKQLYSIANLGPEAKGDLDAMREAMGVMQHHDAITGTEKQHVADDYARILTEAFNECGIVAEEAFNKLMPKNKVPVVVKSCLLSNISSCSIIEDKDNFVVTLYNPLSRPVDHLVRLPVTSEDSSYTVLCPMGKEQENQVIKLSDGIISIPGRVSKATAQLFFVAKHIPPLGYKSYFISRNQQNVKSTEEEKLTGQPITVGYDEGVSLGVDGKNGKITHIIVKGVKYILDHNFSYYVGASGNNKKYRDRSSGAYIFRPNGTAIPIHHKGLQNVKIYKGEVVTEIHQTFSDWVSLVIRLRRDVEYAEFEWLVGPIPIGDGKGKEVISSLKADYIKNNGVFFTDSNGREYIKRELNFRETWPLKLMEKVSGNYYPVSTTISIADDNARLSVITDRAQGGSSLDQGQIELMVHRRLLHDDAFGVEEALNETAYGKGLVAIGSHFLSNANLTEVRKLVQSRILDVWTFISPTEGIPFSTWQNLYDMEFSALRTALPDNIQILTLEPWKGSTILLRLEHIMASMDDPELSKPVSIDLMNIFSLWTVTSVKEVMLGADLDKSESIRLTWLEESSQRKNSHYFSYSIVEEENSVHSSFTVTLKPMDIKTFIISVS